MPHLLAAVVVVDHSLISCPTLQVSGVQGDCTGFGLHMTAEELAALNVRRAARGKPPTTSSPGIRFLKAGSGKGREGWWNSEKFMEQARDIVDAVEILYPGHQLVFEVDWSCGHNAFAPDALRVENMNVKYGGKQAKMRETVVSKDDLGRNSPQLKDGDTQFMQFQKEDGPPWYDQNAPADDVLGDDGKVTHEGYVGRPKGMKQILWERGLWDDVCQCGCGKPLIANASKDEDQCRSMSGRLKRCHDFATERSEFDKLLRDRGTYLCSRPNIILKLQEVASSTAGGRRSLPTDAPTSTSADFTVLSNTFWDRRCSTSTACASLAAEHGSTRQYMRVYLHMATAQPDGARQKDDIEKHVLVSACPLLVSCPRDSQF